MPKLEVHILACDEQDFMPYALRHWTSLTDRVIVHDAMSTDRTREICAEFGAKVVDWKTDGVNDKLAKELKETCWQGTDADWVACVDCDELLYFPGGFMGTMAVYDASAVAVVKPHGFEMFSEAFPVGDGQAYDEVTMGCPEAEWYSKSVLFAPRRIQEIVFSAGAHETLATLKDGTKWNSRVAPNEPATYFLHFRHLGSIDRDAARYARQQARHSKTNIANKWGNFAAPLKHAQDKRAKIMAGLQRVIQ